MTSPRAPHPPNYPGSRRSAAGSGINPGAPRKAHGAAAEPAALPASRNPPAQLRPVEYLERVAGQWYGRQGKEPPGGIQAEARQALNNIRAIVEGCGGSLANAVKVQLFLRDMSDFAAVNEVWAEFFPEPRPARTTIQSNIAYSLAVDVVVALDV